MPPDTYFSPTRRAGVRALHTRATSAAVRGWQRHPLSLPGELNSVYALTKGACCRYH